MPMQDFENEEANINTEGLPDTMVIDDVVSAWLALRAKNGSDGEGGEGGEGGQGGCDIPSGISNPSDGQVLTYDAASGKWVNANPAQAIQSAISNPQNGQALIYNSSTDKWENADIQHQCLVKIITATVTAGTGANEGHTFYNINESYNDLMAEINAGKLIFIKYTDDEGTHIRTLTDFGVDDGEYYAKVGGTGYDSYFTADNATSSMVWDGYDSKRLNVVDVGQVDFMTIQNPMQQT